jgi:hypothetical protein
MRQIASTIIHPQPNPETTICNPKTTPLTATPITPKAQNGTAKSSKNPTAQTITPNAEPTSNSQDTTATIAPPPTSHRSPKPTSRNAAQTTTAQPPIVLLPDNHFTQNQYQATPKKPINQKTHELTAISQTFSV